MNLFSELSISDWLTLATVLVNVLILGINLIFYIGVAPNLNRKLQRKELLYGKSVEFLDYLSDIVSFASFDGVPTKIRKYCLSIHLCFSDGVAPKKLDATMESVFQAVKARKTLVDDKEINVWNDRFRELVRELRIALSDYCGIF